jgi:hypothetical protein
MKNLLIISTLLICGYSISYLIFRKSNIEIWVEDNNEYVIFPKSQKWIYYIYRPATYVDSKITSMNFHIGEHQN